MTFAMQYNKFFNIKYTTNLFTIILKFLLENGFTLIFIEN